jgi:hypothetical protein
MPTDDAQRIVHDWDTGQPISGPPVLVKMIRDLLAALAAAEQARDDAWRLINAAQLGRLAALAAVATAARAYRAQHDECNADPEDGVLRCPCSICDDAVRALDAAPAEPT